MKITTALSFIVLAVCAGGSAAHECKVVCDAADKTPVCGSDGKTYSSKCFLAFAKCDKPSLKIAHERECEGYSANRLHITVSKSKSEQVDDDDDDSDSDSDSEEERGTVTKVDVKVEKDKCEKECIRDLEELCASDGNTYNNHCLFEIALCRDESLTIVDEDGPCPDVNEEAEEAEEEEEVKDDKCNKGCSRDYRPVCASNGKTYGNKCLFENAQCKEPSLTITQADGECDEVEEEGEDKCAKGCSRELDQLCASDGKTYNNYCLYEIAHCRNTSLKVVDRVGPCPEK